ncbi:copper homeostasis protein CutC [Pirellulaceae bacterium SH449]
MLEVCVQSEEELVIAEAAGAQRIELCSQLDVGGVTPPIEVIRQCVATARVPVVVLVRNRPGDFCFSDDEKQRMLEQAEQIVSLGVHGIAAGCLTKEGDIDTPFLAKMRLLCHSCQLVFHRAFDEIADKVRGVEILNDLGVDRILTSGGAGDATHYLPTLRELQHFCLGRVELLPAGGIRSKNLAELLAETQCTQIHASFRTNASAESHGPDPNEIKKAISILNMFMQKTERLNSRRS